MSLLSLVVGCAASGRRELQSPVVSQSYEDASASALAFDAPAGSPEAIPALAREPREPSAFFGYQDTIAEYFVIGGEDHQSDYSCWNGGYYDRWSYTVKTGVVYR